MQDSCRALDHSLIRNFHFLNVYKGVSYATRAWKKRFLYISTLCSAAFRVSIANLSLISTSHQKVVLEIDFSGVLFVCQHL